MSVGLAIAVTFIACLLLAVSVDGHELTFEGWVDPDFKPRLSSEAKVFIPMVGPRLEQLMLVNLVDLFRGEAEETVKWLEERKPGS